MAGVVRNGRSRASKLYDRKVRFQHDGEEVSVTSTPTKRTSSRLVPGAESHRLQKRKGASATYRRSGGLSPTLLGSEDMDKFFNEVSYPYPRTPMKAHRSKRFSLPTDRNFFDEEPVEIVSSSPSGKAIGMPDITDFSDEPDTSLLDMVFGSKNTPSCSAERFESVPLVGGRTCRCDQLERENEELRQKYDTLHRKHQQLAAAMANLRAQLPYNGAQYSDQVMFDADDELEASRSSIGSSSISPSLSEDHSMSLPSLSPSNSTPSSSYMASPVIAEAGSPIGSPALPVRIIDEDYDEGWDHTAIRRERVRREITGRLGLKEGMTMEQTLDRLTHVLAAQTKIADDDNASIVKTNSAPKYEFPPLVMPSLPKFEF